MKKAKMICAKCGAEMNHHADKVDYDADDALSIDPAFDGVLVRQTGSVRWTHVGEGYYDETEQVIQKLLSQ